MAVGRDELCAVLDSELRVPAFNDYCPNGLQVEGRSDIKVMVSGVTACQALLDKAVELDADAVLVHHGYFWRGEDSRLVGMKAQRVKTLLEADINLFAYHLPLDCHPTLGNNAGLARAMGLQEWQGIDPDNTTYPVFCGTFDEGTHLSAVVARLEHELKREALVVGDPAAVVRSAAWCTGGGQGYIDEAASLGADVFVTGEVSEQTVHVARERGIAFIAAGHHATERFGADNLGQWIAEKFGIEHHFVDIDNPA